MAEFKVTIEAVWQKDGAFEDVGDGRMLVISDDANDQSDEENME